MTESTNDSNVNASLTLARHEGNQWRLHGKKWFTSAITSQMALTLARPQGNGPGGSGLAMFYLETHGGDGRPNGIRVERLKDKLGTRKVPTAELLLDGALAELVGETHGGTRSIEPMLAVTRAWNSVTSAACMRRGMALAAAYAAQRRVFGALLSELPLHADTLAGMEAETRAAFLLAFELVELLGCQENDEITDEQRALLRLLTPIAKLLTAKQAVAVVSEAIEAFGGAGYVEDTGLPALLRDTQVLPIWEGTTNVLALDALLRSDLGSGLAVILRRIEDCQGSVSDGRLAELAQRAAAAVANVGEWMKQHGEAASLQAGARRIAMTIGRALQLVLLVEHANWSVATPGEDAAGAIAAARRFAAVPIDQLTEISPAESQALLR